MNSQHTQPNLNVWKIRFSTLVLKIFDVQIQIIIRFGSIKIINTYLDAKNSPHTT